MVANFYLLFIFPIKRRLNYKWGAVIVGLSYLVLLFFLSIRLFVHFGDVCNNYIDAKTSGLCSSGTNGLSISWLQFMATRGERQFLKAYANHTIWHDFNARRILWRLRSLSIEIRKPQQHLLRPKSNSCLNGRNSTLCLHGPISTDVFSKSSNSQEHLFRARRHPHSSPISCLEVYYDNGDCHIFCTRA